MAYDPQKVLELEAESGFIGERPEGLLKQFALAVPRGVEGLAHSTYNLADYIAFDVLPDYDDRLLGTSSHWAPALLEGLTQFAVPYGGFAKVAGVTRLTGMKALSRTERLAKRSKNYARMMAAGAAADFVAFDPNEGRMSDWLVQVPGMQNALTDYLSTDMDDSQLEGRLKNVLEGGLMGPVLDAAVTAISKGARASRHIIKQRSTGRSDKNIAKDLAGREFDASDELSLINEAYAGYDHRRWMLLNTLANTMGLDRTKVAADLTGTDFEEVMASKGVTLDQAAEGRKGYTIPAGADRVILGAFRSADISTGVHELGHAVRILLFNKDLPVEARMGITDEMIDTVGVRMGAELDPETGKWDFSKNQNAAEEKFAESFERYVMEGIAPTKKLRGVFGTLASFMRRIYQGVTEGPMAVRVSPEMKGVFDELVKRGDLPDLPAGAAQDPMTGARGNPMFQVNRYGKQPEEVEADGLESLSRGDLQAQAKEAGIKANQKSADIIEQLRAQRAEEVPVAARREAMFQTEAGRTPREPFDKIAEGLAIEEMKEEPGVYWRDASQMSLTALRSVGGILGVTGNTKEKLAYRIRAAYQPIEVPRQIQSVDDLPQAVRDELTANGNLGFDSQAQAWEAIWSNPDWATRWEVSPGLYGAVADIPGAFVAPPRRDILFQTEAGTRTAGLDEDDLINWDKLSTNTDLNEWVANAVERYRARLGIREKQEGVTVKEFLGAVASELEDLGFELGADISDADILTILRSSEEEVVGVSQKIGAMRSLLVDVSETFMATVRPNITEEGRFVGSATDLVEAFRQQQMMHRAAQSVSSALSEAGRSLRMLREPALGAKDLPEAKPRKVSDIPGGEAADRVAGANKLIPKATDEEDAKRILESLGGRAHVQRIIEQDFVWKEMNPGASVPPTKSVGMLPAVQEYWMNNILSGLTMTHAANMVSGLLRGLIRPLQNAVGSAITLDFHNAKGELRELVYFFTEVNDAIKAAAFAFRQGEGSLVGYKGGVQENRIDINAISAAGLGQKFNVPMRHGKGTTFGGKMLDWVGTFVNIPSRLLLTEDEFFKQLNYRAHMRRRLVDQAEAKGYDANWIEQQMHATGSDGQLYTQQNIKNEAMREGKAMGLEGDELSEFANKRTIELFDSDVAGVALQARQIARESTFTQDLRTDVSQRYMTPERKRKKRGLGVRGSVNYVSAAIGRITTEVPMLKFIFPFVRTPTNILQFFLDNSVGALSDTMRAMTDKTIRQSLDPSQRADLAGRMATAGALFGSMYALASNRDENGLPVLTGAGPIDSRERKLWQSYGWQPYSIRVGDKYVSYRRMDPFAIFAGLVADMTQEKAAADMLNRQPEMGKALMIALTNNLASKSYLTGAMNMARMLNSPEQEFQHLKNTLFSGFAPMSGFTSQVINTQMGEDYVSEVRTVYDAFMQRLPGGFSDLPVKRDVLGDKIEKAKPFPFALFGPTPYTEVKNNKVNRELLRTGASLTPPPKTTNDVDWTEFEYRGKETAYDRWMELHGTVRINGRTLKQQLERTIRSQQYQLLSLTGADEIDSPRVRVLRNIVGAYRARAKEQVLREIPALNDAIKIARYNEQALKRPGSTIEDLIR